MFYERLGNARLGEKHRERIDIREGRLVQLPCFPATASRRLPTASLESSSSSCERVSAELGCDRLYTILVKRRRWKALLTLGTGNAERRSERKLRHDRRKRVVNGQVDRVGGRSSRIFILANFSKLFSRRNFLSDFWNFSLCRASLWNFHEVV